MLINSNVESERVRFVSYTGRFPNLCGGILTLLIEGKEVRFGHNYLIADSWKTDGNYSPFWRSGGELDKDYCAYSGEWEIDVESLPEEYKKYSKEIDEIFNNEVPHGCCGGCA